ncbi:MAG: CPBP family intramembrane metalloprotease [Saprospiraceae bacterium]|nr:CPBP family intramembrane metalloprotease [Pyrinomonadaceae bacterium]
MELSRVETRNLEVAADFAKLSPVENIKAEPIENFESWQDDPAQEEMPPTPNDPPWSGWVAFGVWAASVLAIIIFPAIFLLPYLVTLSGRFENQLLMLEFAKTDPTAIILQIVAVIPAHIFTLLLAWLVVTAMRKYSFRQTLGWKAGGMRWWYYLLILIIFFAFAIAVDNYFPAQETELNRILKSSRAAVFIVAFMATFTAPLVEEVVYRGILYSAFQRRFGVPIAVIVVTAIFTLVHVPQYMESSSTIFLLVLLSLILTMIRVRTGNLLPCIILHTIFNGLQSVLLILEPYFQPVIPVPETAATLHLLLK